MKSWDRWTTGPVGILGLFAVVAHAADIGTAFTYQGSLENGSGPVTDNCDFRFGLWDAAAGGNQVGNSPQSVNFVVVADGVFTVTMDFGAGGIDGAARWLEIEVKCPPDVGFTSLLPRVALTPAPHAIRASKGVGPPNALEVDTATGNVGIGTDSPFFPLHVPSASVSGRAIYGQHTAAVGVTYGVYGRSDSTDGRGVYGEATPGSGTTYGVYGQSNSTIGLGVYGVATAGVGGTYGVYGRSDSNSGRGVSGFASASTGSTYGGRFLSDSTDGRGVFGWATAGSGTTYGVSGRSDSNFGLGVHGVASAGSGTTYGGWFESNSNTGVGVYGVATGGVGGAYGVSGRSDSNSGRGVFGFASANSGTTYGVYGQTTSPDGFAGYFTGPSGSKNYFAQNVGIGTSAPDVRLHVDGGADASLIDGSGYLVVGSMNSTNIVMDTNEIIARNNGAADDLFLNNGSGNVGILRSTTSHPLHVGTNTTNGNGAHLTAGGTWTNGSDRDSKQNFSPIDTQAILQKVAELSLTRWQYKGESDNVHHIGPVAQDFFAAFEVGHDERYITTIDADGIALASIQELDRQARARDRDIDDLRAQNTELAARNRELETRLSRIESLIRRETDVRFGGAP